METTEEGLKNSLERFFTAYYQDTLERLVMRYPEQRSLEIDYWDLDRFDPELADDLSRDPDRVIPIAESILRDFSPDEERIKLRIRNLPEKIPIREIRSSHIGKLISIEGLVKRCTEVRPKVSTALFRCDSCTELIRVEQEGFNFKEPAICPTCNRKGSFTFIPNRSIFSDFQKLEIQENPEELRGGEQPQTIALYVEGDLSGMVWPGDRVVANGVIHTKQRSYGMAKLREFDLFMDCINISPEERGYEELAISDADVERIIELSKEKSIVETIIASISPTIYGMREEKEGLAIQLFGGVPKRMPDGTRIRGDVHILIVGDPGTAKSQLLMYMGELAPRGIYTSGKGSSSAGLTAAAVKDEFGEGRWSLEAGALVLGDRGLVCIDEIDKMRPEDRSSMHEAMEQQRISIAKAGITATLPARCAMLGAANPKYGRFDADVPISEQINLSPTLLSRFDLIMLIRDLPNRESDTLMAEHILKAHRLGEEMVLGREVEEADSYTPQIGRELLKKYVAYARRNSSPVLSKEAEEKLKEYYLALRGKASTDSPLPITARQLEAFVRISEASARMRLSHTVTEEDADRAIRLIEHTLNQIALDQETGMFDIDIIATGTPHSQKSKMLTVRKIIVSREGENPRGASIDAILEECTKAGMDEEEIRDILAKMKDEKGIIYSPQNGYYKMV
jgi:replicative DNA helicase Mcm